mmetsp:Transcript_32714/g.68585  ORF Transcript_32714/g.68585 Transcript_32714/m.68585 type:complete len:202 (-) Transcript_32714:18-623(-)
MHLTSFSHSSNHAVCSDHVWLFLFPSHILISRNLSSFLRLFVHFPPTPSLSILSFLRLRSNLPLQNIPHVNLLPRMIPLPLLIRVTARNRNLIPHPIKCQTRHARRTLGYATQLLLVISVPRDDGAVGPSRGEGTMDGMEGYIVHGVDRVVHAMAFEGVLLLPGGYADIIQVFDGYPPLDASHGDALRIRKEFNASRLILE